MEITCKAHQEEGGWARGRQPLGCAAFVLGQFLPGDVFIFVEGRVTTRYKCVSLTFVSGGATTRYKCAHSTGVSPCPGLHICTGSCYDPVEMC
jgi:hypothetical protein